MRNQPKYSTKKLKKILKKHSGRNSDGIITVRHQGGRQKRFYRTIDFARSKKDIIAKVIANEYDPNRNVTIDLVEYSDKEKRYILHPEGLKVGDTITASVSADIKVGNALPLKLIPIGTQIHNIELYANSGGQMVRSAGAFASIVAREGEFVHLKLMSGEVRRFFGNCWATIGVVGNSEYKDKILGKAGRSRLMGIRPTVRGTAQNPRSHPHGGGEGRSGEGMHPKTPWGKSARGTRTRNKKNHSNKFIIKRRK